MRLRVRMPCGVQLPRMLVGSEKVGPFTLHVGEHSVPDAYWAEAIKSSAVRRWIAPGAAIDVLDGPDLEQASQAPGTVRSSERPTVTEAAVAVVAAMTPRPPQVDDRKSTRGLKVAEALELVAGTGDAATLEAWLGEDSRKSVQSAISERLAALEA